MNGVLHISIIITLLKAEVSAINRMKEIAFSPAKQLINQFRYPCTCFFGKNG
jgi:hypothetical protein